MPHWQQKISASDLFPEPSPGIATRDYGRWKKAGGHYFPAIDSRMPFLPAFKNGMLHFGLGLSCAMLRVAIVPLNGWFLWRSKGGFHKQLE